MLNSSQFQFLEEKKKIPPKKPKIRVIRLTHPLTVYKL